MRKYLIMLLILAGCSPVLADVPKNTAVAASKAAPTKKPNVLFISIDDLRPELGSYGSDIAITPNLDALAKRGVQFNQAHAQQAICGPSRASILTGIRPDSLDVHHNYQLFRHKLEDVVTLPQHFANNGYEAFYVGKIFHHTDKDEALSWNVEPAYHKLPPGLAKPKRYALKANQKIQQDNRKAMFAKYGEQAKFGLGSGPAYESADVPDTAYHDGYNTELAIATMKEQLNNRDKPLFIGFGMMKPHLPWIAPQKYWDLYNPDDITLAENDTAPIDGAAMGLHASFELRTFSNIPKKGPIAPTLARTLKHAYLANISYVDAQIGKMLAALEEQGILDNTIVIVWSDHGWHLGEMGIWGKATNYDIATRVPLIIATPDMKKDIQGQKTDALVELVDIYPTLSALAGLNNLPQWEGQSMVPLLTNPAHSWKPAVFSQFPTPALREWGAYPLRSGMRETYFGPLIKRVEQRIKDQQKDKWDRELFEQHLMGNAIRTERYRLVAWQDTRLAKNSRPLYLELYDHQHDPNESINVAKQHPKQVAKLLKQLYAGWQISKASLREPSIAGQTR
ncbi:sulfatase [Paraglaciecola sp. T6c]|uniref:sulfatase n=1 Tax=Pseudoalteromonas atlantica (strain T6c / ATCC BAA-1087) TaxID=3042615 RepID=UPI00005C7005|nr:sulfatase [Paraglaciecola sp. T6c]ABG39417.1 sulfatase [Paraglaciecola sp. T6c]